MVSIDFALNAICVERKVWRAVYVMMFFYALKLIKWQLFTEGSGMPGHSIYAPISLYTLPSWLTALKVIIFQGVCSVMAYGCW